LLTVDRAYAEAARSVNLIEALVAPLAPQGVFLAPGPVIVRGPDAARALLSATPSNARSKWSWMAIRVDVSSDGKEGYTMGYTELTQPSGVVLPGRYLAYWAKQRDGTWKVEAYKRIPRAAGAVSFTPRPASRRRTRSIAATSRTRTPNPGRRRGGGRSGVQRSRPGRRQRGVILALCGAHRRAVGEFGEHRVGLRPSCDRGGTRE
jgi:ketosteroid isomerase-like protein